MTVGDPGLGTKVGTSGKLKNLGSTPIYAFNRYKDCGLDGLNDRSRAPYRQANKLLRQYTMVKPPAISTVHAVLDRNGLVKRKKQRRYKAQGTTLIGADSPNDLWCAD